MKAALGRPQAGSPLLGRGLASHRPPWAYPAAEGRKERQGEEAVLEHNAGMTCSSKHSQYSQVPSCTLCLKVKTIPKTFTLPVLFPLPWAAGERSHPFACLGPTDQAGLPQVGPGLPWAVPAWLDGSPPWWRWGLQGSSQHPPSCSGSWVSSTGLWR